MIFLWHSSSMSSRESAITGRFNPPNPLWILPWHCQRKRTVALLLVVERASIVQQNKLTLIVSYSYIVQHTDNAVLMHVSYYDRPGDPARAKMLPIRM